MGKWVRHTPERSILGGQLVHNGQQGGDGFLGGLLGCKDRNWYMDRRQCWSWFQDRKENWFLNW